MPYGLQLLQAPAEPITVAEARLHLKIDDDDHSQDIVLMRCLRAARRIAENATGRQLSSAAWQMTLDRFPGPWNLSWAGPWGAAMQGQASGQAGGMAQGAGEWGWKWWLDHTTIRVPRPPLQAVSQITYIDPSGAQQTLAPAIYQVDNSKLIGLISPTFEEYWPITNPQHSAVAVQFVAGHGPVTSLTAAVAPGQQTVTPASMFGIYPGTQLIVDLGLTAERLVVQSVAPTTFTALFAQGHDAGCLIAPGIPDDAGAAMLLLLGHLFEQRGGAETGTITRIPRAVVELLHGAWDGRIAGDGLVY